METSGQAFHFWNHDHVVAGHVLCQSNPSIDCHLLGKLEKHKLWPTCINSMLGCGVRTCDQWLLGLGEVRDCCLFYLTSSHLIIINSCKNIWMTQNQHTWRKKAVEVSKIDMIFFFLMYGPILWLCFLYLNVIEPYTRVMTKRVCTVNWDSTHKSVSTCRIGVKSQEAI